MASENLEFGTVMESLVRARQTGEHLTPAELIAYSEGNLPSELEHVVREHLAVCSECTSAVLDLSTFPELPATVPCPTLREMWDDWKEVQRELGLKERPAPVVSTSGTSGTFWSRLGVWRAVAAALVVPVLLLGFWTLELHQRVQPHGAVLVEDLAPADRVTRGAADEEIFEVPAQVNEFFWALTTLEPLTFPAYEVDVQQTSPVEGLRWNGPVFHREGEATFLVKFSRDYLPAGDYLVVLYGVEDGVRTPIDRFKHTLAYAGQ